MSRWTLRSRVRGVSLTLCLAGAVLSGVSCREDDIAGPTEPVESGPALATATAVLSFRQVSVGGHTCGVTTDDRVYCWGGNLWGQLGDGTTTNRSRPVAVLGGLHFRYVSAGGQHTCGLTTDDRAYCWGFGVLGQLGDGSTTNRSTPVAVAGGRRFRGVSAGRGHSCAVTQFDRAFCWGSNNLGQLGDGTNSDRPSPVRVKAAGLLFHQVSAGASYTCGVTTGSLAYCWGSNFDGQLGDGTKIGRSKPVAVYGGRLFRQVSAGEFHTCGVTRGQRAYCWGLNKQGQLGNGNLEYPRRLRPVAVAGGLQFDAVNAGRYHTCGVTADDLAYCWGWNTSGQLGDGTNVSRSTPVAVVGALQFTDVGTGAAHSCGVTTGSLAYCWGTNSKGELGDGTTTDSPTPVPVAEAR
jgi:alpha-tubulin suppressor-like RCC1 family protein